MPFWLEMISIGIIAIFIAYLIWKLLQYLFKDGQSASSSFLPTRPDSNSTNRSSQPSTEIPVDGDGSDLDSVVADQEDVEEPVVDQVKVAKIKKILAADVNLAELFAQKYSGEPLQLLCKNETEIRKISAMIPVEQLELYNLAANQELIKFHVSAKTTKERVNYPTPNIEVEQIGDDYSNVQFALTEQLLLPGIEFARQLVMNELLVINFYEKNVKAKLLYILLDISGSMQFLLNSGLPRNVWARGVIVNLLISAQKEGGKFFYREFSDSPGSLITVETIPQMKSLANSLLRETKNDGGTDIKSAISTAVNDILTKGGDIANADLLVITDGDDDVSLDWLKNLLGDKIKLHYVALGITDKTGQASLREIATTFVQFT